MSAEVIPFGRRRSYAELVAAEVRAHAARKRVTGVQMAAALGMSSMSVSRRTTGQHPFTVDELAAVAALLDVPITDLLPEWAPRGSNPEPTVYGVRHLVAV